LPGKGTVKAPDLVDLLQAMSLEDLLEAMSSSVTYVNYSTELKPGGKLRGQLEPLDP
jgi:hypothetical protein